MLIKRGNSVYLAVDGEGRSMPRPGRFTPEKEPWYPSYRRLYGFQGWSGREWKRGTLLPSGSEPQTVQPVAKHYAEYAVLVPRG